MTRQNGMLHLFAGIGVGAAIGWAVGTLYAPQAGRRTRRQLASKAEDTLDTVRKHAARVQEEALDLLDRGQAVIEKGAQLYRAASR